MSPKEKAKELVEWNYFKFIELTGDDEGLTSITVGKPFAIKMVDEMLGILEKLRKPEYTTFIEWEQLKTQEEADTMDGYEYIDFLKEIKTEIENL